MKATWHWLQDYWKPNPGLTPEGLWEPLTLSGVETEPLRPWKHLADIWVVEVQKVSPHPDAHKLKCCKVWDGKEVIEIVCGAPNVRQGLKTALAKPGSLIPSSGLKLEVQKVRGVPSHGMLCSGEELNIDPLSLGLDPTDGILELKEDTELGITLESLWDTDPVMDLDVTPNRGDLLGIYGIARELAALGLGQLVHPLPGQDIDWENPLSLFSVETKDCSFFSGCLIQGVFHQESPLWMKKRLESVGIKPFSSIVDSTNYLCHAFNRPFHSFDYDKIQGKLKIRHSEAGEVFESLNDEVYELPPGLLVIADEKGIVSLGGIKGGKRTACTQETTRILLECALFSPEIIAKGGQFTHILSEARSRFERGLDPDFAQKGLKAAIDHIFSLFPTASILGGQTYDQRPKATPSIHFAWPSVEKKSGLEIPKSKGKQILEDLGCQVEESPNVWQVTPPSWRQDLSISEDLTEEILRIYGYEHIPACPLPSNSRPAQQDAVHHFLRQGRACLSEQGFFETLHLSFIPREWAQSFEEHCLWDEITLKNPVRKDMDTMRPSLLPQLLHRAQTLTYNKISIPDMYEVGPRYLGGEVSEQPLTLTGCLFERKPLWKGPQPRDLATTQQIVLKLLHQAGIDSFQVENKTFLWSTPGQGGSIKQGRKELARFGEIHPSLRQSFNLEVPAWGFEIFTENMVFSSKKLKPFSIPSLQKVEKDLSFLIKKGTSMGDTLSRLTRLLKKEFPFFQSLTIKDVFQDPSAFDQDHYSLSLRLDLQPQDRPLTDEDIEKIMGQAIQFFKSQGFSLRGQWPSL